MKPRYNFILVFAICGWILLNSVNLLADDEVPGGHPSDWGSGVDTRPSGNQGQPSQVRTSTSPQHHRYGVVSNNNSYPVNIVLNGSERHTLRPNQAMVVPIGTQEIEVRRHILMPLGNTERLNVDFRSGGYFTGERTRIQGFDDSLQLREPTGGYIPSNFGRESEIQVLTQACYPQDRLELGLRKLQHRNSLVRGEGADLLGELRDQRAVEPLLRAMEDENEWVKKSAMVSLGEIGDQRAVGALARELSSSSDSEIQRLACGALGKIGGDEAFNALRQAATSSSHYGTKAYAIGGLADTRDPRAAEAIRNALNDDNQFVRAAAARELGEVGSRQDIDALKRILSSDSNANVRKQAAEAIGRLGNSDDLAALSQALNDSNQLVRNRARSAIQRIGGQGAVDTFRSVLSSGSPDARSQAMRGLVNMEGREAEAALIEALSHDSEHIRAQAAWVLGQSGSDEAIAALGKALKDPSEDVRRYAALSLGRIGGDNAANVLRRVAKDSNESVRTNAQQALRRVEAGIAEKERLERARLRGQQNQTLKDLNETYMEDRAALQRLDPNSEEAKARMRRLKSTEEQMNRLMQEEETKHGSNWRDIYRDDQGRLPGGLLEDDQSQLVKLQDLRQRQQERADELQRRFEQLREESRPLTETWQERLRRDQQRFREEFIRENGPPEEWDEQTQQRYMREYHDLTEQSRRQWEADRERIAQKNRELGRTINELARARNDLNETERRIRGTKNRMSEAEAEVAQIHRGQEEKKAARAKEAAGLSAPEGIGTPLPGVSIGSIQGYAVDYTDDTIGFWNSGYPNLSFDDEENRRGLPNGVWEGSYYFQENTLYLVIDNLRVPYPPLHTLGIGYTVTLEGATFEDGSNTKNLILYRYSGTPDQTRIVQSFRIIPITRGDEE